MILLLSLLVRVSVMTFSSFRSRWTHPRVKLAPSRVGRAGKWAAGGARAAACVRNHPPGPPTLAGLLVPNVKDVGNLSVLEVAQELARLQERHCSGPDTRRERLS